MGSALEWAPRGSCREDAARREDAGMAEMAMPGPERLGAGTRFRAASPHAAALSCNAKGGSRIMICSRFSSRRDGNDRSCRCSLVSGGRPRGTETRGGRLGVAAAAIAVSLVCGTSAHAVQNLARVGPWPSARRLTLASRDDRLDQFPKIVGDRTNRRFGFAPPAHCTTSTTTMRSSKGG